MKNKIIILAFILIAIFGAFAFEWNKISKEAVSKPINETVTVAYGKYLSPIFVAYDKGLFEKHGIKVQMQLTPDTTAMMQGIATGAVDVATPPYSVLFDFEKVNPAKFRIYGGIVETVEEPCSYLIVKDNIKSPSDLIGKKIVIRSGINSKIQSQMILNGLDINPDRVEFVQVDPSLTASVFAKPEISAAIDIEPSATAMLQHNLGKVLISGVRPKYIVDPYPTVAQIFSTDFVTKRPQVAEAFREAVEEGIDYIRANEKDYRDISQKWLNLDPGVAANMNLNVYQKLDELDKSSINNLVDFEVSHKILDTKVNFDNVYFVKP